MKTCGFWRPRHDWSLNRPPAAGPGSFLRMNRELVERSTHPEALEAITEEMGEDWREHAIKIEGAEIADNLTSQTGDCTPRSLFL